MRSKLAENSRQQQGARYHFFLTHHSGGKDFLENPEVAGICVTSRQKTDNRLQKSPRCFLPHPSDYPGSFFSKKTIQGLRCKLTENRLQNTEGCFIHRQWRAVFFSVFCFFMQTHSLPRLSPPETPDSFTVEACRGGLNFFWLYNF